jgi:hypothetical protein
VGVDGLTEGSVSFEISCDGVVWSPDFRTLTADGCFTKEISASFIRAVGTNAAVASIGVSSQEDAGGAALTEPRTCLIYAPLGTDEGTCYTDFNELMAAKAAIKGPVRICVTGPDFSFLAVPPPTTAPYDFINTEFFVDAHVIFVLFTGAQDWNALPSFSSRTVGLYLFDISQPAYDTSRGTNSPLNQANLLGGNEGRNFLSQFFGTFPMVKVTAGRQVVFGSRNGGLTVEEFTGGGAGPEMIELEDDGEFVYLPQGGQGRFDKTMVKSTVVGDGRIAVVPFTGCSRDQFEFENQSGYSGAVIASQPLGQPGVAELYNERQAPNPPTAMDAPGAPTVYTAAVTADHGDLILCDSDGGSFTLTLKSALGHFGEKVTIMNIGADPTKFVTIAAAAGETIVNGPVDVPGKAAVAGPPAEPAGTSKTLKIIRSEDNVVAANRVWAVL